MHHESQTEIKQRGFFIVFEGLDRSGKTTQSSLLLKHLNSSSDNNGDSSQLYRFPNRETEIGQKIDAYLQKKLELDHKEIHKLFADNREECIDHIKGILDKGIHVVVDRYAYSGVAYSVANGVEIEYCKLFDQNLPHPDIVFYIDLPEDEIEKRSGFGEERFESKEFQKRVREAYKQISRPDWKVISGKDTIENISHQIKSTVDELKKAFDTHSERMPLKEGRFWEA